MFIARFIVKGMENQLETVRPALAANNYIKENSLNIRRSENQFLYNTVNKTAKPKETSSSSGGGSSTHTSSSGRTHGGTGGSSKNKLKQHNSCCLRPLMKEGLILYKW